MTTPFLEPYGTVYRGTGSGLNLNPISGTLLPVGINTISVSTRYTGQVNIRSYFDAEFSQSILLGTIPAGSGPRSITITFGVRPGDYRTLTIATPTPVGADVQVEASVITLPLKTAG